MHLAEQLLPRRNIWKDLMSQVQITGVSPVPFKRRKQKNFGLIDIVRGIQRFDLADLLARSDIRQRYRRSTLGPFWITISTAIMIACLGFIFGTIFKSSINEFLPFISAGLIIWGYLSSTLTEATTAFTSVEGMIKQLPHPLFLYVERMVMRNFYIFVHNIVIFPIVCLIVRRPLDWDMFLFLPGILLLTLNLTWMSLMIGIFCTRFRDMAQILINLLRVIFYVTPIIWMPGLLSARTSVMILEPNPFYHLMEIVRAPLMGNLPTALNWGVSFLCLIVGTWLTLIVYNKYRNRIAYWL